MAFALAANAQTSRGNFLIGGSMSFLQSHSDVELPPNAVTLIAPNTTFSLSPTVGYFVANNFLVGLETSVSLGFKPGEKDVNTRSLTIGPIIRYYFPFGKFAVFPEIGGGFNKSHAQYKVTGTSSNPTPVDSKTTTYRAGAGVTWFAAPNIGIEGILGYRRFTYEGDDYESHIFFNVGLQFYLRRNE